MKTNNNGNNYFNTILWYSRHFCHARNIHANSDCFKNTNNDSLEMILRCVVLNNETWTALWKALYKTKWMWIFFRTSVWWTNRKCSSDSSVSWHNEQLRSIATGLITCLQACLGVTRGLNLVRVLVTPSLHWLEARFKILKVLKVFFGPNIWSLIMLITTQSPFLKTSCHCPACSKTLNK